MFPLPGTPLGLPHHDGLGPWKSMSQNKSSLSQAASAGYFVTAGQK